MEALTTTTGGGLLGRLSRRTTVQDPRGQRVADAWDAVRVARTVLSREPDPATALVFLDAAGRVIGHEVVARSWIDAAQLTCRDVLRRVLRAEAASFYIARSRNSPARTASSGERRNAQAVRWAGAVVGLTMHDHVVVGTGETAYCQFGVEGWTA